MVENPGFERANRGSVVHASCRPSLLSSAGLGANPAMTAVLSQVRVGSVQNLSVPVESPSANQGLRDQGGR